MATTKKAGDSLIPKKGEVIVAKDQSGAVAVIHKGDQSPEQWGQHVDAAMGSGHEVFKDGVRVETPPDASTTEKPHYKVPSREIEPGSSVVAPNGATEKQVTEGGTPGTYHELSLNPGTDINVPESVVKGANTVAGAVNSAYSAVRGVPVEQLTPPTPVAEEDLTKPIEGKPTSDEKKLEKEVAPGAGGPSAGGPSAGGGAPAVPDEDPLARAFAVINKNHALVAEAQSKADAAHQLAQAHTDMAITERQFADQQMQADQIQKQAEDSVQKHIDAIQAEQAKLDPTISRDRYWQNKSGAQVAAGALAAACFGFAGKGMDYLKMIQAEVDADVQAQQMSFDNARGNLKDQRQGFENQFERAMKSGMSRKAAIESARIATLSSMQSQIQAVTQQGISDVGMANMQVISEGLGGDLLDAQAKAKFEAVRNGKELAATHLMNAQAQAQRAKAAAASRNASHLSKNAEKVIQETDTAVENAKASLRKARAIIAKTGSVNVDGPEDKNLNRYLNDYAVFAAKAKDPNSIVSISESKRERASLGVDTGIKSMDTRNDTYLEIIDDAMTRLDEQKASTRKNRGAESAPGAGPGADVGGSEHEGD